MGAVGSRSLRQAEAAIQTAIVVALHRAFDCRCASNNNGGSRGKLEAIRMKAMGTWPGYPDLSVFGSYGCMFLIEVKEKIQVRERAVSPWARFHSLSMTQKLAVPELRSRGFDVLVTDDVDEAVEGGRLFGLGPAKARQVWKHELAASTGF